jgi:release factor glutamine methyltransferase
LIADVGVLYDQAPEDPKATMTLSIAEAVLEATVTLRRAGIPEPRREASSLLAHVLGQDRAYLITHGDEPLGPSQRETFHEYLTRRAGGEPLQYISGRQEFFGLDFEVTRDVLIPRPETELLVETALDLVTDAPAFFCDIGTGSGCISIALLHQRANGRAVAVDVSEAALCVARRNAERHHVGARIDFVAADCFSAFQNEPCFDLIISNPPYVADSDLAGLQREVREHEPLVALTSGRDGLAVIRRLLVDAPTVLNKAGYLLIEIGFNQRAGVEELIDPTVWKLLDVRSDLQGIPRIVALQIFCHKPKACLPLAARLPLTLAETAESQ